MLFGDARETWTIVLVGLSPKGKSLTKRFMVRKIKDRPGVLMCTCNPRRVGKRNAHKRPVWTTNNFVLKIKKRDLFSLICLTEKYPTLCFFCSKKVDTLYFFWRIRCWTSQTLAWIASVSEILEIRKLPYCWACRAQFMANGHVRLKRKEKRNLHWKEIIYY